MLTFLWKKPVNLDRIVLQEDIRKGQFVETFEIDYMEKGSENQNLWKPLSRGTTIGYKRILRTKPVTSMGIRLRVLSTLEGKPPFIESLKVYKSSPQDKCPRSERD